MTTPITVYDREECAGHIITVFQKFSTTGATKAETVTLNAGYPSLDLSKAHPIISIMYLSIANDTVFTDTSEGTDMTNEVKRGTAPDGQYEFDIEGYNSFKYYTIGNADGLMMITYWAAGVKQV